MHSVDDPSHLGNKCDLLGTQHAPHIPFLNRSMDVHIVRALSGPNWHLNPHRESVRFDLFPALHVLEHLR